MTYFVVATVIPIMTFYQILPKVVGCQIGDKYFEGFEQMN